MCGYTCTCDQLLHVNACVNRPVHVNMSMHVLSYIVGVYTCVHPCTCLSVTYLLIY